MSTLLAVLLVAAVPQDDLAKRVAALVERLGSEKIDEREKATAELVKLGVPAFKAIQGEHGKSSGEVRQRLEAVIKRIERSIRCDALLGPQVTVSLKADKRPVAEVLEELKKASGQPIECRDVPADPVTLSLEKVQVWEALDRICQAHGGVMWRGEPGGIIVERKPYRPLPKVFNRNFAFYLTQFEDRLLPRSDMALSNEDRNWLDEKFGEIHARITRTDQHHTRTLADSNAVLTAKIEEGRRALAVHEAKPCSDVEAHVKDKHDLLKFLGILTGIATLAGSIGALCVWLAKTASTRP